MKYSEYGYLRNIAPLLERLDRGEILAPEEQEELAAIRSLDGDFWNRELPASIATLTGLQRLWLMHSEVRDLSPLSGLINLNDLFLCDTKVCDLSPLFELRSLRWLDLYNTQVCDLTPLSSLSGLQRLSLSNTQVRDLAPLSGLTDLQRLDVENTQVCELTPLSDLGCLQELRLDDTRIRDLTPLSGLGCLQELRLGNTQIHDLTPLSQTKDLQMLWLDYTQVQNLSPLSGLEGLKALCLSGTKVQDLSPLSGLKGLQELNLSSTRVHDLSPLSDLPNIKSLQLRFCELRALPQKLAERFSKINFAEELENSVGLCLYGATLSNQPIRIFREGREVIREYYAAPKTAVRESKVIFLGDGGAGKTHTMKRILANGDDTGFETDPTLGIHMKSYPAVGRDGDFAINFWDFGGQENMHAMHRCFLTERTLYVVVISNRGRGLDQQARYWLDNIHSFAPKSPVILALNQWEGIREFGLDTNRLQRDYPNLVTVVPYTAKEGSRKQFETLAECIVKEAEKLDSCAMELPEDWAAILQELRQMAAQEVGDDYKGHIDRSDYLALCEKHGLGGEEKEAVRTWLLEWFNDLGVCFSYHRDKHTRAELDNYKVLEPKWLTSAIYILLNAKADFSPNGIMSLEVMKLLLALASKEMMERKDECDYILKDVKYSPEECEYILQVMRKFGLSYQVNEKEEFIPSRCSGNMPKDLHPSGYAGRISYEFRYSFLPDSVVQRLMVRLYEDKRLSMLWNQGFRIDERKDHGIVTVVDGGSRDDKLRIDIYSYGDNRGRDVMARLIDEIGQINAGLNLRPEAFVIVQGRRGEFAAPADMILQAKEEKLTHLHLYSRENGLVKQNVDEILGDLYGPKLIQVAEQAAENRQIEFSRMLPQVVHNNYYYGDIYKNDTPDSLLVFLDRMAERNEQLSDAFVKHLLVKLDGSGQKGKELALDIRKNKGGALKALTTGLKALPKIATGAKVLLTDGAEAVEAAQPVIEAVKNAFATYGPEIVETVQGLIR